MLFRRIESSPELLRADADVPVAPLRASPPPSPLLPAGDLPATPQAPPAVGASIPHAEDSRVLTTPTLHEALAYLQHLPQQVLQVLASAASAASAAAPAAPAPFVVEPCTAHPMPRTLPPYICFLLNSTSVLADMILTANHHCLCTIVYSTLFWE